MIGDNIMNTSIILNHVETVLQKIDPADLELKMNLKFIDMILREDQPDSSDLHVMYKAASRVVDLAMTYGLSKDPEAWVVFDTVSLIAWMVLTLEPEPESFDLTSKWFVLREIHVTLFGETWKHILSVRARRSGKLAWSWEVNTPDFCPVEDLTYNESGAEAFQAHMVCMFDKGATLKVVI
jgi:hypothetical protein